MRRAVELARVLAPNGTIVRVSILATIVIVASLPARADPYDDANADSRTNLEGQQHHAADVAELISTWTKEASRSCDGLSAASTNVQVMESQSEKAYTLKESADVSSAARERYTEADRLGTPIFLDTYLNLADAYLEGRCFTEADRVYRDVIRKYTGGSYEAFRERARIGVDDVRAGQQDAKPR